MKSALDPRLPRLEAWKDGERIDSWVTLNGFINSPEHADSLITDNGLTVEQRRFYDFGKLCWEHLRNGAVLKV